MDNKISSHKSKTWWIVAVVVLVVVIAAAAFSGFTKAPNNGPTTTYGSSTSVQTYRSSTSETLLLFDQFAGVWTTDRPANYSTLVTLVFQTTEKGVMYELVGNSYMAEAFNYTVINGGTAQTSNGSAILQITKSGSPMQEVPFSLLGNSLNLHYDGNNVTLVRNNEPVSLHNKY
ncbi:MAG: hypothetical protein JRN06_05060 [Nitrososphaerota archaeon]|nr:hypothetical protein [Nitrososphaerota archaeon]MDG7023986.1 hypothetical protein [Nitrososphaerota archaeon]